jgi:hypothetical protein
VDEHPGRSPSPEGGSADAADAVFAWHPRYQGRTLRQVRDELTAAAARDQRAYALAMEGAEEHEQATLATVVELEKKWGGFDLDWATADPAELAAKVAAFERAREDRRELIPYAAFRLSLEEPSTAANRDRRQTISSAARFGLAPSRGLFLILLVIGLIAVVLYLALS